MALGLDYISLPFPMSESSTGQIHLPPGSYKLPQSDNTHASNPLLTQQSTAQETLVCRLRHFNARVKLGRVGRRDRQRLALEAPAGARQTRNVPRDVNTVAGVGKDPTQPATYRPVGLLDTVGEHFEEIPLSGVLREVKNADC